jgi:arginyl-tRNA synthetase
VEVEEILKEKGLIEESGGSSVIDLRKHSQLTGTAIIRDRGGSGTYLLRDIASVLERDRKYSFDKMIYVVAADHNSHFIRLIKILELMGMKTLANKLQHISFSEVSQMSKVIDGHVQGEFLNSCQSAMQDSLKANPEKAELLGNTEESVASMAINALMTQELSAKRATDHGFDISRMTSFGHGTGPDIEYSYAKLCSILTIASDHIDLSSVELPNIGKEDQVDLLRLLIQYPDITCSAYKTFEPAGIVAYLVNVTNQLNTCFETSQDETGLTPDRAVLFKATRKVLECGMRLLCINPVTK